MTLAAFAAAAAFALSACSGGGAPGSPAPASSSPAPDPGAQPSEAAEDPTGWLLTATTSLFTASGRLCPDDGFLDVPVDPDWAAFRTEINGGPPDDWDPDTDAWSVDQGVTIDLDRLIYYFDYSEGGTRWQVTRGDLSIQGDAEGRLTGGSGSGTGEWITDDGDGGDFTDELVFTLEPIPVPTWCP